MNMRYTENSYRFVEPWHVTFRDLDSISKLNALIDEYNDWQLDGFAKWKQEILFAHLVYATQTWASHSSDSIKREIDGMKDFVSWY